MSTISAGSQMIVKQKFQGCTEFRNLFISLRWSSSDFDYYHWGSSWGWLGMPAFWFEIHWLSERKGKRKDLNRLEMGTGKKNVGLLCALLYAIFFLFCLVWGPRTRGPFFLCTQEWALVIPGTPNTNMATPNTGGALRNARAGPSCCPLRSGPLSNPDLSWNKDFFSCLMWFFISVWFKVFSESH